MHYMLMMLVNNYSDFWIVTAMVAVASEETERERTSIDVASFFIKGEAEAEIYICAGLDSDAKLKKRIRSRRSVRETGEAALGGICSDQSRPLDGEIERRTFQAAWRVLLVKNPSRSS